MTSSRTGVVPPCPPPPGGWPRSGPRFGDNLDVDVGDLKQTGAAVALTTFRPGPQQLVLVVAASNPDAVEARLRPREQLSGYWDEWGIYGAGEINDDEGQPHVMARLVRLLPEIAAWAAPLPEGILQLKPWLAPAAAGRSR